MDSKFIVITRGLVFVILIGGLPLAASVTQQKAVAAGKTEALAHALQLVVQLCMDCKVVPHVDFIDSNGHVHEMLNVRPEVMQNSEWKDVDLTAVAAIFPQGQGSSSSSLYGYMSNALIK